MGNADDNEFGEEEIGKTSVPSVSVCSQSTLFSTALVLGMQRGIEAWRLVGETGL